jgi:DNA-binding GntR family transcriptional regulator
MIKIIDESKIKLKNKIRDEGLKEHLKSLDAKKVQYVKVIRSAKGEIILYETQYIDAVHTKSKSKKEVSK